MPIRDGDLGELHIWQAQGLPNLLSFIQLKQ